MIFHLDFKHNLIQTFSGPTFITLHPHIPNCDGDMVPFLLLFVSTSNAIIYLARTLATILKELLKASEEQSFETVVSPHYPDILGIPRKCHCNSTKCAFVNSRLIYRRHHMCKLPFNFHLRVKANEITNKNYFCSQQFDLQLSFFPVTSMLDLYQKSLSTGLWIDTTASKLIQAAVCFIMAYLLHSRS